MYCIECGAQIPDNSKFCSHCGQKQTEAEPSLKEKIAEVIIEKEITRQVIEAHKSSLDYQFLRKAMGWYLAWILLHLFFLLVLSDSAFSSSNSNDGLDDFWPFGRYAEFDEIEQYDITEFLVYTIFPLVILIIISLTKNQNKSNENSVENN
jgi:hypothetical protein